jgi:glutathione S-transferase
MPTEIVRVSEGTIPNGADGRLTVGYWDIRGLGQPIRLALEYVRADFVDVRVHYGPGEPSTPGYKQFWKDEKPALAASAGLPFGGNLPYLVDGDVALVQSNSILRHIGRKYNLLGDGSAAQSSMIDMLLDQMADCDDGFTGMCYGSYNDGGKEDYVATKLPTLLTHLAGVLADKPYFVCGTPTVPDFKIFELLDKCKVAFGDDCLDAAPTVAAYWQRMRSLPTLAAYLDSEAAIARPLNNAHAQFK